MLSDKIVPRLGEIYYVRLQNQNGSAQQGFRPCIVAQNGYDIRNTDMVWAIPLTSRIKATHLPFHVIIKKDEFNGLNADSMTLIESMSYIRKSDLGFKIGVISDQYYPLILQAIWSQFLKQWDHHNQSTKHNYVERMAVAAV